MYSYQMQVLKAHCDKDAFNGYYKIIVFSQLMMHCTSLFLTLKKSKMLITRGKRKSYHCELHKISHVESYSYFLFIYLFIDLFIHLFFIYFSIKVGIVPCDIYLKC